ncbi:MAG: SURF1 family protein [Anaplasma sp.]
MLRHAVSDMEQVWTMCSRYYARLALRVCVCAIPCLLLCLLGTWQLFRLQEKLQIIEKMRMPAVALSLEELRSSAYRQVTLWGSFKDERYFRVYAGEAGYYFLQPFALMDGRHILVNRGTFSDVTKVAAVLGAKSSFVSVEGVLYCESRSRISWAVQNSAQRNLWFWFDIAGMAAHINLALEPCIVWGSNAAEGGLLPNKSLKVRNDHLEYAITWYSLALVWLFGCVYFIFSASNRATQR